MATMIDDLSKARCPRAGVLERAYIIIVSDAWMETDRQYWVHLPDWCRWLRLTATVSYMSGVGPPIDQLAQVNLEVSRYAGGAQWPTSVVPQPDTLAASVVSIPLLRLPMRFKVGEQGATDWAWRWTSWPTIVDPARRPLLGISLELAADKGDL